MSVDLGDRTEDSIIYFMWSTNATDGSSITRATDGTVSVYKNDDLTQSVAGITDTEDFDTLTGIHSCKIDLSADAFYAIAKDYTVVLSGAVIDTKNVNAVLATFSIENRFNEVTLADDAITSAKYDETTAYPVKSADTGATQIARVGADSDTLETISDQLDANETKIDTIDGIVDSILLDTGTDGVVLSAAAVDDILDEIVDGSYTMRHILRLLSAAMCGKSSGAGTGSMVFRDLGDTKNRVSATVTDTGNRTVVTLNAT